MLHRRTTVTTVAATLLALGSTSAGAAPSDGEAGSGRFQFTPLPSSTPCTDGGNPEQPFVLPPGYVQEVFAQEGDGGTIDLWDMNTQNETALSQFPEPFSADSSTGGPHVGRFLYRTHETSSNGQVSVTDLGQSEPDIENGRERTRVLAQRPDWERFDGIVWTPWGTILAAEETSRAAVPDPQVPQAQAGLVYEIDPVTGAAVARPAIGSRSHEGLRFDAEGNLYGISETGRARTVNGQEVLGGFIYRFTPDEKGDLSSGTLFALKVTAPTGDRTGEAVWVPLDPASVQVDSDAAAAAVQATGYDRPEDVETAESTGNNHGSGVNAVYVAITGEDRVLKIDLREPRSGSTHLTAFVSDYVRDPVNAPTDFDDPDNLALDHAGNLHITEDPGGTTARGKQVGDDIWVAEPPQGRVAGNTGTAGQQRPAERTVRFASLTDCDADPTGHLLRRRWRRAVRQRAAPRGRRPGPGCPDPARGRKGRPGRARHPLIRQSTPGRAKGGVRGDRNPVVAHTAPSAVGLLPWSVSPNDHDGLEALADRAILAHREGTAVHLRPDDLIYWTGGQPGPDPHAWHAAATQHTGSWWEPWAQSMLERSGEEIPAPTALGSADHPSREPAPGTYVVERRAS